MVVSELAPLYFVMRIAVGLGFIALGALDRGVGVAGLVLMVLSELGLVAVMVRGYLGAKTVGHQPPIRSYLKVWERLPGGLEHLAEVPYDEGLTLDVYRKPGASGSPTLVYVHPGSWMRGRPGRQARTMFHRLANEGWVILDIRYPLSPQATFPEHLVGVKKAISWAKEEGGVHGVDPSRIVISGGSSGAHLAALAALTTNRKGLQPGFEESDTSVVGCVVFYGIYDLLVRNPTRFDWPFIARYVLKATPEEDIELYRTGSPVDQVHSEAPPFLVVHGSFDSIVLATESHHFVEALTGAGVPVTYVEVPWAQHGFDAIASYRTRAVAERCVDWLGDYA